jgi:hypothetical protein
MVACPCKERHLLRDNGIILHYMRSYVQNGISPGTRYVTEASLRNEVNVAHVTSSRWEQLLQSFNTILPRYQILKIISLVIRSTFYENNLKSETHFKIKVHANCPYA